MKNRKNIGKRSEPRGEQLLVVKPRTGYSLRSDSETVLVIPKVTRKTFGDRAFFHAGPTVWNALPSSLRNCRNIDSFN